MTTQNQARGLIQVIEETSPLQIATLDQVKSKFIQNFNASHKEKIGELVYARQLIYFNQLINGSSQLQSATKFSLYACFVTAAVKDYSFDPADNEVYLIPRGGKAYLQPQAGAYVKRLIASEQIKFCDQATLVYKGDIYEVEKGKVLRHVEKFETEEIVAGYVKMIIDDFNQERYFTYRKSDWESWRKKSSNAKSYVKDNGTPVPSPWDSNNGQPEPGFLRTKLILHACKEKCFAIGQKPVNADTFEGIEIDDAEEVEITSGKQEQQPAAPSQNGNGSTAHKAEVIEEIKDINTTIPTGEEEPGGIVIDPLDF